MSYYTYQGEDLLLRLYFHPKSSRDEFIVEYSEELKIAITAPSVNGKANAHLVQFLSQQFAVAKSAITVEKELQSRHKFVRIKQPKKLPSIFS